MAISLTVFRAQIDGQITADDAELSQLTRNRHIKSAIERYSIDRPDEVIEDESGDAGKYYAITGESGLLTSWVEGFSRVVEIEYPAATIDSDEAPQYLDREDWRDDYIASSVRYLYLPNHAPAATETMRIRYTAPWLWTASSVTTAVNQTAHGFSKNDYVYQDPDDSAWYEATDQRIATHQVSAVADENNFTAALLEVDIPVGDFFAVCHLAAALCCDALSAQYARIGDSTVNVDSAAHVTKSQEFARQAKRFMELYNQHLGLGQEQKVEGTGDFVDWDTAPGWPSGRQYIFHGNR